MKSIEHALIYRLLCRLNPSFLMAARNDSLEYGMVCYVEPIRHRAEGLIKTYALLSEEQGVQESDTRDDDSSNEAKYPSVIIISVATLAPFYNTCYPLAAAYAGGDDTVALIEALEVAEYLYGELGSCAA